MKESGFSQKSLFWWNKTKYGFDLQKQEGYCYKPNYSAPTSDEILKNLPPVFGPYRLTIEKKFIYYQVSYIDENDGEILDNRVLFDDKKLSNALAKCWLFLRQNGYLI